MKCIYCKKDKNQNEFSLEHIIPQFLGGAQAPDKFKTRKVCKTCNSNLGLFVDASFEKDFLVFSELKEAAHSFFDDKHLSSLPLKCMGISQDLNPPEIEKDEVCECWIGPFGEQIYWIRPSDERLSWYSGGNPRTVKKQKTRAYFMFSENTQKNPIITWFTFRDAFMGRKVIKIMCGQVDGANPKDIGFSEPDILDTKRINYFKQNYRKGQKRNNKVRLNLDHDVRFMTKLAIGISNILFDDEIIDSDYSKELHKGLWYKEGEPKPLVIGGNKFTQENIFLKESDLGFPNGVTITIQAINDTQVIVNLNLNKKMNWWITCAKSKKPKGLITDELSQGICIILFKTLSKCVRLSFADLIAHNSGCKIHSELQEIEQLARQNSNYFNNYTT